MSEKKFYLTTPIYYVNARPHIGHAYTTIVGDVLARRHRLLGEDVYFLTGTDEHGQKIERSAAAAGIPPQQFADQVSASFEALWKRMGITNDDYIRTTEPRHKRGAQKLFRTLYERGFIYLASYTGSYCVSDEAFIDAPVGTPCPDCGRLLEEVTEENFFFRLSAFQKPLIELVESGALTITPDAARNEVLNFLRGRPHETFAEFRKTLNSDRNEDEIGADEAHAWAIESGRAAYSSSGRIYYVGALKDLSISRSSFTWGIPVPEPAASEAKQPHVIYVWLDALANYMTALGYGSDDETLWQKFWPADLHLVGKEITRFHCVYWPAFLLAAGLPLPKQITANGWLLFDNAKMSKSKGNIVRTETILDAFGTLCPPVFTGVEEGFSPPSTPPEKGALAPGFSDATAADRDLFAADVLRYYLVREIPFGQDGSFSFDALITRYNADLANGYGNLVSRTLNMIQQYFGEIPNYEFPKDSKGWNRNQWLKHFYEVSPTKIFWSEEADAKGETHGPQVLDIFHSANALHSSFEIKESIVFGRSMARIQALVSLTDLYISNNAPWKLAKAEDEQSRKKLAEVLYTAAESIRIITALLHPILPYATSRVWAQLGLGDIELAAREGKLTNLEWGGLEPGTKLGPQSTLFPSIKKQDIPNFIQMMTDLENPQSSNTSPLTAEQKTEPASSDPAAAPRTTTLPEPGLTVAGSHATTTGPEPSLRKGELAPNLESPSLESPQITIDDFAKIDLRVAQIVLAERIPKADKLLRLEVDLGPLGRRQILSGIAEHYTPEELLGRRIVVIANLAPRKMRGLESHGMLLAASEGDHGKPHLATCGEEIALGSRLK